MLRQPQHDISQDFELFLRVHHFSKEEGMTSFTLRTTARCEMIDITDRVAALVKESGIQDGSCLVFVPHTTAAVTINENADPDVPRDILASLDRIIPLSDRYRHAEGNAAAHIKASLFGASQTVFIESGRLVLGTWQSLFFCEFDGPRTRQVLVGLTAG
jgi:secondary thiamine-phosphate synthase enzyme